MKHLVVQISGKQGSGKDTLADVLSSKLVKADISVSRYSYAKVLYQMQDEVLKIMSRYVTVPKKDGRLLQLLGTDWARENYGNDVWLNIVRKEIDHIKEISGTGMHYSATTNRMEPLFGIGRVHLITDCRWVNTAQGFPGGLLYRLDCPEAVRKERVLAMPGGSWREIPHESESSLDEYKDFDYRFWSDLMSTNHIAEYILKDIRNTLHRMEDPHAAPTAN